MERNFKQWTETLNKGQKLEAMDRNFKRWTETLNNGQKL